MTVCIISKSPTNDFIVAVSDNRISWGGNPIQANDTGALKQIKLSRHWGMMAASDDWSNVYPIFERARELIQLGEASESLVDVQRAVGTAYREIFRKEAEEKILGKYGICSYNEFTSLLSTSLSPMLSDIKEDIDKIDLGTVILVYGVDPQRHFCSSFEVHNPGKVVDLNWTFSWAIGSGATMAMASLSSLINVQMTEELIIYRAVEAKFSAETADGVGHATTGIVLYDDGSVRFLMASDIEALRNIWETDRRRSIPQEAIERLEEWARKRPRWQP